MAYAVYNVASSFKFAAIKLEYHPKVDIFPEIILKYELNAKSKPLIDVNFKIKTSDK